jgi:hypothetical protein
MLSIKNENFLSDGTILSVVRMTDSVPDRRSRILEVVIVRRLITWVLGMWRGEGLGKGLRKGRSVYKQPETKVDGSCHS